MKPLCAAALVLAVLAATRASGLEDDDRSLAPLDDVLKSVDVGGEVEQLERHPRNAGRLIKYLILLMKRGGPNVQKKVMDLAKPLAKKGINLKFHKNSKFKSKLEAFNKRKKNGLITEKDPHRPPTTTRKKDGLIAEKDPHRPPTTIMDALDAVGIFDFLWGGDDDDKEAPPRKKTGRRRSK